VLLYSYLYSIYISLTSALNNVSVSSSAIVFGISALAVISHDFAGQPPCASSYLYSTRFSLIRTLYALSSLSVVQWLYFLLDLRATLFLHWAICVYSVSLWFMRWILCLCYRARVSLTGTWWLWFPLTVRDNTPVSQCALILVTLLVTCAAFLPAHSMDWKCSQCHLFLSPASPLPITLMINRLYSTGLFVCCYCNRLWRIRTSLGSVPPTFSATSVPRQADLDFLGNRTVVVSVTYA